MKKKFKDNVLEGQLDLEGKPVVIKPKQERLFKYIRPEVKSIKIVQIEMSNLGKCYKCEECGCILMSEDDAKRHIEYHKSLFRGRNVIVKPYWSLGG